MGRNHMNAIIATIHVLRLVILKNTCEHIVVRNLTNVTSVTMPALPPVILGDTKKLTKIQRKGQNSRTKVCNNNRNNQPQQLQLVYSVCNKCTYFCLTPDTLKQRKSTQDRRSTHVNYVGMSASSQVHWSDTSRLTKGMRISNVYTVVDTIQRLNICQKGAQRFWINFLQNCSIQTYRWTAR